MNYPLKMVDLSHSYQGRAWPWQQPKQDLVLKNIGFQLKPGTITGLLGINGAGKTSLIQCALGLIKPQQGNSYLYGQNSWDSDHSIRQQIAYVPQLFDLALHCNAFKLSKHWGHYYKNWDQGFVEKILRLFGIPENQPLQQLSIGQRQKISIALALGHRPNLLVLDEPVASLDPLSRRQFLQVLIEDYWDEHKTILFSSHITSDIERIASDVLVLKDQEILLHQSLDELKQNCRKYTLENCPAAANYLKEIDHKLSMRTLDEQITFCLTEAHPGIDQQAFTLAAESLNLEALFLELHT